MMLSEKKIREKIVWAGKEMCNRGLTSGTAGNISMRIDESRFAITPSGVDYFTIKPEDIVVIDFNDNILSENGNPSVEKVMHRKIYEKRPEVNAIVHAHSIYSIAVSAIKGLKELPLVDLEMLSYLGGNINISRFAPSGSLELAEDIAMNMGDVGGMLIKNHGSIGIGLNMEDAFLSCEEIEKSCRIYLLIKSVGDASLLPQEFIPIGRKKYLKRFGKLN